MKKLSFLFLLVLLSTLTASAQTLIDGIYYNLNSDTKTAAVTSNPNYYSDGFTIPDTVTYEDVKYTVTEIEPHAFFGCRGLTYIIFPNTLTTIGEYAFPWCSGLTGITIPGSVKEVGSNAFYGCTGITDVSMGEGVTSIGYGAFYGCKGMTSVSIPNSITKIDGVAFCECSALKSVIIPESVTTIGDWAFFECSALKSITIPSSVTSIGENVISGCTSIASVTVESGNKVYDSRENCNAIIETATNTLIASCRNTVIPNSVTALGNYAFSNHPLPSVEIPSSVTSIGKNGFAGCSDIKSFTLPSGVTTIGESAFRDCTSLTSFSFPEGVTEIQQWTIYMCTGLKSVTIPSSVTNIATGVFVGCNALTDIYCYAVDAPTLARSVFSKVTFTNATLHVPEGSIDAYKAAATWSSFGNIVAIDESEPVEPEVKKCATPMIAFFGGRLIFRCATPDVKYLCNVEFETDGTNVTLPSRPSYVKISVCATKEGYEPSETLSSVIDMNILLSKIGDINGDGIVNGTDIQEVINIIVNGE